MFRMYKAISRPLSQARLINGSRSLYTAPVRDINFVMNDVLDFPKHYEGLKNTGDEPVTQDTIDMLLPEMAKFAEQELAPLDETADSIGCKHNGPNDVTTPPGFKAAYQSFVEGGWQGLSFPESVGGQGLPSSLSLVQTEMVSTACWTWTMFPGLSKGAINTIYNHGSDSVKGKYLEQLITGEFTGTMCLTEPQCGSDLAQVKTKAEPIDGSDNMYKVSGTKIFISCGEHDMTENIIHCVLARTPEAPPGTKGISLFAVPKVLEKDGKKSINNLSIGRIEDKMGCHGSPTCEVIFEEAEGELIGDLNKGLNHMFTFINTSRLGTAIQGLAACEKSYQNSIAYALDRKAMHSLQSNPKTNDPTKPDLIIVHPAVRSLLLKQKAFAEGARAMILECAKLEDLKQDGKMAGTEAGNKQAKDAEDLMGFYTPILKGFITEIGLESSSLGIQVFGGHGYIKSNGQEQIMRDVRIASLWEGTTQIQALDLLGRKIMLNKLKPLFAFCKSLYSLSWANMGGSTTGHAIALGKAAFDLQLITMQIARKASKNRNYIGISSEPYLMMCGYIQMGAHWLRMEAAAQKKLKDASSDEEKKFLESKIKTSKFYFDVVFPRISSLKSEINVSEETIMGMKQDEFAFYEK